MSGNGGGLRPRRQQYHYLYGSTEISHAEQRESVHQPQENESLIGEALVQTDNSDNEGEVTPRNRDLDHQHVLISTNGNGVNHLKDMNDENSRFSWCWCQRIRPWELFAENQSQVAFLVAILTSMVIFAITLFPSRGGDSTTNGSILSQKFRMEFPVVDRKKTTDPSEGFLDKNLFQ